MGSHTMYWATTYKATAENIPVNDRLLRDLDARIEVDNQTPAYCLKGC